MSNYYELAIELLENGKLDGSKENFIRAYEEGNEKSIYYLRKIRNIQDPYYNDLENLKYTVESSILGYEVEIPSEWKRIKCIDYKPFDTITIDKYDKYIYNIKTQGSLIEIPDGCINLISIDRVISNMKNIHSVVEYKNSFCKGKIVKSKNTDGTINYTLMTKGKKGIYEFKLSIDSFLDQRYTIIKEYIFNSFKVKE